MKKNKFLMTLVLSSSCLFALASCQGAQGPKGDQGEPGINGTNGTNGTDGKNGSSVLTGTGVPASTLGTDGDSYIDTETFDFYSKKDGSWSKIGNIKGSVGEQGETGSQGEEGKKGTSLLSGSGIPSSDLGNDGDSYIDTTTFDFYSKTNGEWKKYGNFKGSDGQKGDDGIKGEDGKQGTSVLTGSGEPASTLGNDGDSYIDTSSFDFYTKADGAWTKVGSIKGDKGDQGEKGDKGNSGWSGSKGDKGDTAWSNTILYSEYGYITPSAGSVLENEEISFTVHQNDYDNHRLTGLTFKNPSLDDEEKTISIDYTGEDFKVEKVDGTNDYTFTTTMLKGGFVVSANFASKNLTVSLPQGSITGGSISIDGKTSQYYFPGDTVTLKIEITSKYAIDSFTLDGENYDDTKLIENGGYYYYNATVGKTGLDVKISFKVDSNLQYEATTDNEGNKAYIVKGLGNFEGENLEIPSTYNGKSVVGIADNAFQNNDKIKSIKIPSSVITIGNRAFFNCNQVTKLTIEESEDVQTIGSQAFSNLPLLESVTIPGSVETISNNAFEYCYKLQNITISEGVKNIGSFAFMDCWGGNDINITNKTLKLPNSIRSIANGAFYWCKQLEKIIIPSGVETINSVDLFDRIDDIKVYYYGTKAEADTKTYSNITTDWYFYSENDPQDSSGKYWYYKEGVPTSWNNN